jgi:Uma2 family endonuclease
VWQSNFHHEANMATALTDLAPAVIGPMARSLTAADLAAMPTELPSGPIDFELIYGRLVQMSPPGFRHGKLQGRIVTEFINQGETHGYGEASSETGVVLSRSPDTVVGPDVSFVAKKSFPIRESPEGYLETIPDLVVEVRSKNDSLNYINSKVSQYLQAGVRIVWVVDGQANTVIEHRADASPRTFSEKDILTCDDVIPGFRLNLAELFKG